MSAETLSQAKATGDKGGATVVWRTDLHRKYVYRQVRVCSFQVVCIRISDPRSHGSWNIKGTDESLPKVDSSVPLVHRDLSDLGSLILT